MIRLDFEIPIFLSVGLFSRARGAQHSLIERSEGDGGWTEEQMLRGDLRMALWGFSMCWGCSAVGIWLLLTDDETSGEAVALFSIISCLGPCAPALVSQRLSRARILHMAAEKIEQYSTRKMISP